MKLYKRKKEDSAPPGQPDPFIFFSRGKYYIYATHEDGVQLYRSDKLDGNWEYLGFCFSMAQEKHYWAPAVIELNHQIYLYVSTAPEGVADMHQQSMKVAVADTPEGPFRFVKQLLPPFSIDAHVVQHKGEIYIFYSSNDETAPRPGTYIAVDKLLSPAEVEGKPVVAVRPTIDEEIFCRNRFREGVHWYTIEGAFYFSRGNTHYLTYSGSAHGQPSYFVGYAVAHGDCDDLRQLEWKKYPNDATYYPLLCSNSFVDGPGHNSAIEIDNDYWIVYHGRDVNGQTTSGDSRIMRADRLYIDGDRLSVHIEQV